MRRYALPVVNSHAVYMVVAVRSVPSYRLPLDNALCIIGGNGTGIDGVVYGGNIVVIAVANTSGIAAKWLFLCVQWVFFWHNWYEVVAVVVHTSTFLD